MFAQSAGKESREKEKKEASLLPLNVEWRRLAASLEAISYSLLSPFPLPLSTWLFSFVSVFRSGSNVFYSVWVCRDLFNTFNKVEPPLVVSPGLNTFTLSSDDYVTAMTSPSPISLSFTIALTYHPTSLTRHPNGFSFRHMTEGGGGRGWEGRREEAGEERECESEKISPIHMGKMGKKVKTFQRKPL